MYTKKMSIEQIRLPMLLLLALAIRSIDSLTDTVAISFWTDYLHNTNTHAHTQRETESKKEKEYIDGILTYLLIQEHKQFRYWKEFYLSEKSNA